MLAAFSRMPAIGKVGIVVFAYALIASTFIQTLLVSHLLPSFNLGDGLIILDSVGFNQIAKAKAREIAELGWQAWELRPQGQFPAGVASAFYVLWTPMPYSLLPFNALVHALSACLVFWLLRGWFAPLPAIIGSVVFAVNPSAMEWVAQIHRDGVFILGNLLVLVALMQFRRGLSSEGIREFVWGCIWAGCGTGLVWMARSYWVQVLFVAMIGAALLLAAYAVYRRSIRNGVVLLTAIGVVLIMQGWLIAFHTSIEPLPELPVAKKPNVETYVPELKSETAMRATVDVDGTLFWYRTGWLPESIERKFNRIATGRQGAIRLGGNTMVDANVLFNSAEDVLAYTPRALQLGILSPMPELWLGKGSTSAMTLARKVMGFATCIFYVCLAGFCTVLVRRRRDLGIWIVLQFCLLGILVYAVTYPNIGALMRFRYGFYMVLIAFGASALATAFLDWRGRRRMGLPATEGSGV